MTDPAQDAPDEQVANFGWWLCMLPFVVGGAIFAYLWWQHRGEATATLNLVYGLGTLILGVVFTAMVNDDKSDKSDKSDKV